MLIQEFENLNAEDQSEVVGGFVSVSLENENNESMQAQDTNHFQCGCNNYCYKKEKKR